MDRLLVVFTVRYLQVGLNFLIQNNFSAHYGWLAEIEPFGQKAKLAAHKLPVVLQDMPVQITSRGSKQTHLARKREASQSSE